MLQRVDPFHEEDRPLRQLRLGFLGVPAVIQPHAQNLPGFDRREQLADIGLFRSHAPGTVEVTFDPPGSTGILFGGVVRNVISIEVADDFHAKAI